jgi:tetratricopeptide (TPR) repeat protein
VLLSRANARTEAQRRRAEALRAQAEENFRKARQAVDDYFTKVSESKLLNVPGLQPLRKELLESARAYYQGFLRQRGGDPNLRAEAGAAAYRVAIITSMLGTVDQARPAMEQARALYLGLTRDHPDVLKYWVDLAICDNDLGRFYDAVNDREAATRYHPGPWRSGGGTPARIRTGPDSRTSWSGAMPTSPISRWLRGGPPSRCG